MPSSRRPDATGTRSLERALRLVCDVADYEFRGPRLTELVSRSALDTSTAHRLLKCLVDQGFLQKDASKRYHLGQRVFELGLLARHRFEAPAEATEAIEQLARSIDDTVFLSLRSGLETVCIERKEGGEPRDRLTTVGTRRPIGIGASGVALLAAMPAAEADQVVRANEVRYRAFGRGAGAMLRRRLEQAKRDGYAMTESFLIQGIGGIGVAVPSEDATPSLSLSIVAPSGRLAGPQRDQLVARLRASAAEVAAAMRHAAHPC